MRDPLLHLWPIIEAASPTVTAGMMNRWPKESRQRLLASGLLKDAGTAEYVRCSACERGHKEKVVARPQANGEFKFYIPCPELLRVELQPDELRRFTIDIPSLLAQLASALALSGQITTLTADRVWRLGRTTLQGTLRDVLLASGMNRKDAPSIRGSITQARKPIVFVPHSKPPADYWNGRVPPVIALDQVATFTDSGIEIDPLEITSAIHEANAAAHGEVAITAEQLTLMIRRQIKAEHKSELTDDVFLAAYRQHGSNRKAAAFLSKETGTTISKDQVHRAVMRAGGAAEVLNAEDSDSVVRPVASQSRDRKGKKLIRSKPKQEE